MTVCTPFSFCPAGGACHEVEGLEGEVRLGEAGNLTVLTRGQWNVLAVELIPPGQPPRV